MNLDESLVEAEEDENLLSSAEILQQLNEVERLKYVVTSYLRCRIQKIQRHSFFINSLIEKRRSTDSPLVTPEEAKFLQDYISTTKEHFDVLALRRFPPNISTLKPSEVNVSFQMGQSVFIRVLKDSPNVLVEDPGSSMDIDVELREGSRHLLPYKHIADLVKSRNVALL
ncbi:hypothetical protein QYM36_015195 [Artemia franciscana]|uniref:DNA replication complex GINS protein SLD5 n=1 Tax=Artemia franciscana TaxID=6661 RepID=A0AA88L4B4_ARTSF|nr:hypothetical protein QYM36_015195 [Artemia franciscana]